MLPDYNDIRSAIDREPDWFDGRGVPRYEPFSPTMLGVYDKFALLVRIGCQSCDEEFLVGEGWQRHSFLWSRKEPIIHTLESLASNYHYGDPPRHGCVGDTMNCWDREIMEAWGQITPTEQSVLDGKPVTHLSGWPEWVRYSEYEGIVKD